ncbi:hypothetical protein [Huintestinicola sp.]|uniref:hypothetical protein n=1 Tax=Huintestinicola sp. TaxID=2981661 RepID=UPI003D7E30E5
MKRNIAAILAMCMMAATMTACGGSNAPEETAAPAPAETAAAAETEAEAEDEGPEEEPEAEPETEAEESDEEADASEDFTLLDVSSDMIEAGVYAVDEFQNELVFSMFTAPSGTAMASLFVYCPDGSGDVICGTYTAETETDEDGINWTKLSVSDVYTGEGYVIGFAESADGQVYIFNPAGTVYEGQYLSADDTVVYMGTAVALMG